MPPSVDGYSDAAWSYFLDAARVVLMTLREPTAGMISAAIKKGPLPAITAQRPAIIDAALSSAP